MITIFWVLKLAITIRRSEEVGMNRKASDDPGAHVGQTVVGVIETEFDSGYLVSVMVGSEKLNGVLYQIEDASVNQFAVVPSLMDDVNLEDSDSEPVGLRIRVGSIKQELAEQKPNVGLSENEDKINPTVGASSKSKVKDLKAPRRVRSPYLIFLCEECDRLKKMHGRAMGQNIRKTVNDAWKCLSEIDKLPYIEASHKDKERYDREMAAYEKQKSMKASDGDCRIYSLEEHVNNDYHVSLQTEETNMFHMPNESMAAFTAELMKHGELLDATLQIRWDDDFLSGT